VVAVAGSLAFLPVLMSPLRRMRELPSYEDLIRIDEASDPLADSERR